MVSDEEPGLEVEIFLNQKLLLEYQLRWSYLYLTSVRAANFAQ
jgi:hypothetical protein